MNVAFRKTLLIEPPEVQRTELNVEGVAWRLTSDYCAGPLLFNSTCQRKVVTELRTLKSSLGVRTCLEGGSQICLFQMCDFLSSASPNTPEYDQSWQASPLVGLTYRILSLLPPLFSLSPLIFLLTSPDQISLWTHWTAWLRVNTTTYWNWPKEIKWGEERKQSHERLEHAAGNEGLIGKTRCRETIFLACWNTWTLALTSSKSFDLSPHPNKRGGAGKVNGRRVDSRCLWAAHSRQLGRVSGRSADRPMIYTEAIRRERSHLCRINSKRPSDAPSEG